METILLPLSSNAGASYQQLVNPPKRQAVTRLEMPYANEWQRFKLQKEKELEQSYAKEDNNAVVAS